MYRLGNSQRFPADCLRRTCIPFFCVPWEFSSRGNVHAATGKLHPHAAYQFDHDCCAAAGVPAIGSIRSLFASLGHDEFFTFEKPQIPDRKKRACLPYRFPDSTFSGSLGYQSFGRHHGLIDFALYLSHGRYLLPVTIGLRFSMAASGVDDHGPGRPRRLPGPPA